MIKVLNVITDTNIGGAGRVLVHYLKNFDRSRYEIYVAVPRGSMLIPEIEKAGYTPIETEYGRDRSFEPAAVRELYGIIKQLSPDIVHTHSSLSAKLAAYLAHVRSRVYTRHCVFELTRRETSFPRKQIGGYVNNKLSTAIVAVAPAAAKNLTDTGVDEKKITIIMNGVERLHKGTDNERKALRASLGIGENDIVCTMSARLEEVKGHEYFIRAARIIGEKRNDVKFLIVGTGSIEEKLKRLSLELGVGDSVIFTGFVSNVAPYIDITDININCSWGTEASSLAIAEAMSLGKPTIATDFGGNPSVISDDVNGLLIPIHDEGALAEAILKLTEDNALRHRLGEGARRIFDERFTAQAMTRQLERLYDSQYELTRKKSKNK